MRFVSEVETHSVVQVEEGAHAMAIESNGIEHHSSDGPSEAGLPAVVSRRSKRTRRSLLVKDDKAARTAEAGMA